MRLYLFLLVVGLYASFAQAATWYVATNGNDANTGALAAPFRTLPRALEAASPGDAIELRGGQYTSQEIRITQSNLTIRSYPGEWAVITAPVHDEDIASCIWYSEPDVTGGTLERLEIVGGYYYGVSFETNWDWGLPTRRGVSNVTIRDCKIHHTGRDCIKIKPACNNIHVIRCDLYMSGIGPSNSPANGGPNAEGIDNVNGDGMVVRHCYIHDISTTGVYVKGGAKDCIVEQNLIYGVHEAGILLGFYTDAEFFDQDGTNPLYYECQYSIARNNIVYNTGGAGIGLFAARNCAAYHNTVITASGDFHAPLYLSPGEIWISDQTTLTPPNFNIEVYNNIFIDQSGTNDEDYTVQIRDGALSGTTFINNNIFQKTNGAAQFTNGTHWPAWSFAEWKSQTGFDANSTEVYPALDANLHLMSNSPAIGAGRASPATTDYDGHPRTGAPDIGADDYANGTPLSVPPPPGTIGTGIDVVVGVRQPAPALWQMEASPNPSSGHLRLAWSDGFHPQNIQLYDAQGRLVLASPAAPTLQLAHLPSGTYHLLASDRDGAWGRATVVVE